MNKTYLGDSVYCEILEDGTILLTTNNGYGADNYIYLENYVYNKLVEFVKSEYDRKKG